jgi:energy-coupling factor transport system substrate-specific component
MRTKTTVVIALCAGLNLAIGSVVYLLKVPIYLDMIGTILCAFLLWPQRKKAFVCAVSAGLLSLLLSGLLVNPFLPWFSGTVIIVAAFTTFVTATNAETFRTEKTSSPGFFLPLIGYGLVTGVIAAIASAPIVVYLFGGVTGSGSAMLVAFFVKTGNQLMKAAFLSGLTAEPIDKTIQLLLAIMLYRATPQSFIDLIREK